MKIENTELEYDETEGHILDYYLGGHSETKEQWAQRVWDCCRRHAEGEGLARVYQKSYNQTWQERAQELWDNKKTRRRSALKRELKAKEEDLPDIRSHKNYKTRSQRDMEQGF